MEIKQGTPLGTLDMNGIEIKLGDILKGHMRNGNGHNCKLKEVQFEVIFETDKSELPSFGMKLLTKIPHSYCWYPSISCCEVIGNGN